MTLLRGGLKTGFSSVRLNANESIPHFTVTAIPWDVIIDDEYSMWSSGAKTRLTPPAWVKLVQYGISVIWVSNNQGYRHQWQHQNGSQPNGRGSDQINVATASIQHTHSCWSAPLATPLGTDYFEAILFQNSGAAKDIINTSTTWASVIILGTA